MRVIFLPSADEDIVQILEYYLDEADAGVALRIREAILAKTRLLISNPKIGIARSDLAPGLRLTLAMKPAQKYKIYYRVRAEVIEVARIIHGFQSEKIALFDEF